MYLLEVDSCHGGDSGVSCDGGGINYPVLLLVLLFDYSSCPVITVSHCEVIEYLHVG